MMVKIVISGISGRMGKRIGYLAANDKEFEIVGALEASNNPGIGKDIGEIIGVKPIGKKVMASLDKITETFNVLIDFTTPQSTTVLLEEALNKKAAVVIGTTGFSPSDIEKIKAASSNIPVVFSPNMSVGANLLFRLTEEVSRTLGEEYKIEIVEVHHSKKKDAPSGTAKRLGESVFKVRGETPHIESIRTGDIVGDHTVFFIGPEERIELTHRAHSRDTFAKGALEAAIFLIGKKPGLYNMQDVINR